MNKQWNLVLRDFLTCYGLFFLISRVEGFTQFISFLWGINKRDRELSHAFVKLYFLMLSKKETGVPSTTIKPVLRYICTPHNRADPFGVGM